MPTQSTLTGPFGTPVYPRRRPERERELYVTESRAGRIVPLVVGGIGAAIIAGGAVLYTAGVIGAPVLNPTEEAPAKEPAWQTNPDFEKALGVQALKNLEDIDRREPLGRKASKGSLLPPQPSPDRPGVTVSPPSRDESQDDREMWEPPVEPKPPEGKKEIPKAADPERTPPNGYAH